MLDVRSVGHIAKNLGKVVCIHQNESAALAVEKLRNHNVGCLIVVDDSERVAGIISERDIITKALLAGGGLQDAPVADLMTRQVVSCDMNTPILDALSRMTAKGIRHLPVVEDGVAMGMVSSRDIVSHQLSATKAMQGAAEQVAMLSKSFKSLDYNEVLDLVTREVPSIFGASCGLLLVSQSPGLPVQVVSRNVCRYDALNLGWQGDTSPAAPITISEIPAECRNCQTGPRAVFNLPIYEVGGPDGGVTCGRCAHLCMCMFNSDVVNWRELLSYKATLLREILAVNLMNAKLYEQARKESRTDGLTGVTTRRTLEERLEQEYLRSCRYRHPFCLAMIDVDRFKRVNDTNGHCAGDGTLRTLAKALSDNLRKSDVLARFGGDEFVLLMPETSVDEALAVIERMRTAFNLTMPGCGKITFSCGVSQWRLDPEDGPTDVVRRADELLYEAKRRGRDRTEVRRET